MVSMAFLVPRNGVKWIAGHQKWFPWHVWGPEMVVSSGVLVTRSGFHCIPCGGQTWCHVDFWSPEMVSMVFGVARNGVGQVKYIYGMVN